ncbi:hypothetical protein [Candidatus Stoquefichus massiliensis]|uniref:hypothetical protein n=1 Tax=Candidatus Stoquefichus massiliensis TaxID=1470350 RepID=UPI00048760A3|nr:hypothetical protein [Candidatus Stoquefichus massiliensis]
MLPNLVWMICIFYVLYQDKIENDKKILYLLILNLIFMFSDLTLGKEFINDESIEIVTLVIEFIELFLIAFWLNKRKITSIFLTENSQKTKGQQNAFKFGLLGLGICMLFIVLIYFFVIV